MQALCVALGRALFPLEPSDTKPHVWLSLFQGCDIYSGGGMKSLLDTLTDSFIPPWKWSTPAEAGR